MNLTSALAALSEKNSYLSADGLVQADGTVTALPARTLTALLKRGYEVKVVEPKAEKVESAPIPVVPVLASAEDGTMRKFHVVKGEAHCEPVGFKGGMKDYREFVRCMHRRDFEKVRFVYATSAKSALFKARASW